MGYNLVNSVIVTQAKSSTFPHPFPLPGDSNNDTSQVVRLAMQTDLWIGYDVL